MSSPFAEPLPWEDPKEWNKKFWYPLPLGFMERDNKYYIVDGYMIFKYDIKADNGDIVPVETASSRVLVFSEALEICERHNKQKLVTP